MTFIRDQKQFFAQLRFEVIANFFYFGRHRFPAAHSIARIASPKTKSGAAQQIGIEREHADDQSQQKRRGDPAPQRNAAFDAFPPKINREQAEAKKRHRVPIWGRDLVHREQQVDNEYRRPKPKKEKHLELLINPTPAADHTPGQRQEEQRRIKQKMFAEKLQRLEWTKTKVLIQT